MQPTKILPKKSLAQHFLIDESYLARIVAAANLTPADTVVEIGPGPGNLTRYLAAQAGRLIAIELDDRLIEPLRKQFAASPHVEIVHGDVLETDLGELVGRQGDNPKSKIQNRSTEAHERPKSYKVVANLPYYITSAVLRHVLEAKEPPSEAVLMMQKEVAERICAKPGDLSLLAVSVQVFARPEIVLHVPARLFRPPPKVDSAVLRLVRLAEPAVADGEREQFFDVVRAGFGQKRKQLLNSLSAGLQLSKTKVEEGLRNAGVEPTRRAETLSIAEWVKLTQCFKGLFP